MKHRILATATIIGLSTTILSGAFAANIKPTQNIPDNPTTSQISTSINLYQDADSSSILLVTIPYAKLQSYKAIYTNKDGWTKIGNTQNGDIGWIKPLKDRLKPLETALLDIEKQQNKIVEQYRTEIFKAQQQESGVIKQLQAISKFERHVPNHNAIES
ncbi:hypothetical protein OAO18_08965 [Francisellaceae bacterium]|nr:hypothetical protein [Francisellaceae bacterium]